MAERFTSKDVVRAFELLAEEAQRNGIDTTGWALEQPDGHYWKLYRRAADGRPETLPFTNGFGSLPANAREAHARLTAWREGMAGVRLLRTQG